MMLRKCCMTPDGGEHLPNCLTAHPPVIPKKRYTFEIAGTGADGQTWKATGTVDSATLYPYVFNEAMRQAFEQLTNGRAVFGKPGQGCNGPYDIDRVLIEQVPVDS